MKAQRHLGRDINEGVTKPDGDRRSSCRYAVVQGDAWLGWWEGATFQSTSAQIVDISLRGAMLTVETFPPKETPLYFCPPGMSRDAEWIEVKPVAAKKKFLGPREIRVSFRQVFPYDTFKAVVYGPDTFVGVAPQEYLPLDSQERDYW